MEKKTKPMKRIEDYVEVLEVKTEGLNCPFFVFCEIVFSLQKLKNSNAFFIIAPPYIKERRKKSSIKVPSKWSFLKYDFTIKKAWVVIYGKTEQFSHAEFLDFCDLLTELGYSIRNYTDLKNELNKTKLTKNNMPLKSRKLRSLRGAIKFIHEIEEKPVENWKIAPLTENSQLEYFYYNVELFKKNKSLTSIANEMNLAAKDLTKPIKDEIFTEIFNFCLAGIYAIVCETTGKILYGESDNIYLSLKEIKNQLEKKTFENETVQKEFNKFGENSISFQPIEWGKQFNDPKVRQAELESYLNQVSCDLLK